MVRIGSSCIFSFTPAARYSSLRRSFYWQSSYNTFRVPIQGLCWTQLLWWHAASQV